MKGKTGMEREMTELLPKPKKVTFTGGGFTWPNRPLACLVPDCVDLSAFFQEQGRRFRHVADPTRAELTARIDHDALAGRASNPALLDEGYVLEIASRGLTLSARTERGLYYGLQTLRQLADTGRRLPGGRVDRGPGSARQWGGQPRNTSKNAGSTLMESKSGSHHTLLQSTILPPC